MTIHQGSPNSRMNSWRALRRLVLSGNRRRRKVISSVPCVARAITMPFGSHTNDSPANVRRSLLADPVAERDEVAVLKRGDAHLRLVQPFGPFADRAGLRHDHEIGAADARARACIRDSAGRSRSPRRSAAACAIDRCAGVARRVVALLVKAGVVGDVDHARAAERACRRRRSPASSRTSGRRPARRGSARRRRQARAPSRQTRR